MSTCKRLAAMGCFLVAIGVSGPCFAQPLYSLGTPVTRTEIQGWNIDVKPDGSGLPPGQGSVARGAAVFQSKCAACHGAGGQGGIGPRLVGGQGTLATSHPVRTVGSYWPYATTLFDYVRRAMPFDAPQSLTADQVYALCAWILRRNGIVPETAVMDARSLPEVKMPNRNGFIHAASVPDVRNVPCEHDCK